jgi:hypothetical protein
MVRLIKLAETFTAWSLIIGVSPAAYESLHNRCIELGLEPKLFGYDPACGFMFRVNVPIYDVHNQLNYPERFMEMHMRPLRGRLISHTLSCMICPVQDKEILVNMGF